MKGYKAMAGWAKDLGEKARQRLGCRRVDGQYVVPSESIIRDVLTPPDHGRIETRRIWCSEALNGYLDFPHVAQVFLIEREVYHKKSAKHSMEIAVGLTSQTPAQANAQQVLETNRGHWTIENRCHYVIDWNFDEDRSRIRTGHGPENLTRLRRFAVGVLNLFGDAKASICGWLSKSA